MYATRAKYKKMEKSFNDLHDYIEEKFNDINNTYDELKVKLRSQNTQNTLIILRSQNFFARKQFFYIKL